MMSLPTLHPKATSVKTSLSQVSIHTHHELQPQPHFPQPEATCSATKFHTRDPWILSFPGANTHYVTYQENIKKTPTTKNTTTNKQKTPKQQKKPTPTNKPECKAPRRDWLHAFPRGVLNTGPQIRRVTCVWHAEPGEPGKGKEVTAQHYTRARCCSLCGAVVCHKDMRSNRCTPFSHFSFSLLQMLLTY